MQWTEVFQYGPGLVANIAIVWIMMQYNRHRDEQFARTLDDIQEQHHAACQVNSHAMEKAAKAIDENSRIIGRVDATLQRTNSRLDTA